MPYKIKTYTKNQAKKIGVIVKPSSSKGKKIDVFKKGVKVASVGAIGYNDYPTYMELEKNGKVSKGTAKLRRKLYKIRHKKDRNIKNSNGYYADKLLW
mgnify:FL=1|jgi:hypothetical protein|tara:strand:- start:16814 stop:17107 length:294 start_codon:yes stop_codon:yes gene_type:complete